MNVAVFLEEMTSWAATRADIVGVVLVGSHARGTARTDSDVDLVILCEDPSRLLEEEWTSCFGDIEFSSVEDYGALKSRRVRYHGGLEIEFGVTGVSWARTPLDPGTKNVLAAGARVLYDPEDVLRAAITAAVA